jgi:hypothetical protein
MDLSTVGSGSGGKNDPKLDMSYVYLALLLFSNPEFFTRTDHLGFIDKPAIITLFWICVSGFPIYPEVMYQKYECMPKIMIF